VSSASTRDEALRAALLQRAGAWQAAEERARRLLTGRAAAAADALALADDYRMLAHDVARARRLLPDTRTREFLEAAYLQVHTALHRPARRPLHTLLRLFAVEIPAVVRRLRAHILWATVLFALAALAGYWMVSMYPALIALFASPELIASVEHGQLWTEGLLNVVPSSVLSLQILTNNIVVSLSAYCAGFLFGLGTLYILGLNGLMLGAVCAFTRIHGLGHELLQFIVAHGCVEISVMCLSGAAGAAVGEAVVRPGPLGRAESFRSAALTSGKLLILCVLLLIGCGLIEGYISPDPRIGFALRAAVGVGYWLLMLAMLDGWPWRLLLAPVRSGARAAAAHIP
jgi:uncharacterized membrane protein SpoIIM required for sporulation